RRSRDDFRSRRIGSAVRWLTTPRCSTSKSIRDSRVVPRPTAARLIGPIAGALLCAAAGSACAHGSGQRYDLPIPLSYYVFGAAATVALSFAAVALFLDETAAKRAYPRRRLAPSGASAVGIGLLARVVQVAAALMLPVIVV